MPPHPAPAPHRFLRDPRGFSGAEKALLATFGLFILITIGHLITQGSRAAGESAHRALVQRSASPGPLQVVGALAAAKPADEGGPESEGAEVQAAAEPTALAQALTAPAVATTATTDNLSPRDRFLRDYRAFLDTRLTEVAALQGDVKAARIEGLLIQMRDISAQLAQGQIPDVAGLDAAPAPQELGVAQTSTFLPPELIGHARRLIQQVERPLAGATARTDPMAGGTLYGAHGPQDWNAFLGVPQYRTQSDNLAGPEVTCNVTSMAMIAERLGFHRQDVMDAIDRALKQRYLREQRRDPNTDLAEVELPANYFQNTVSAYLRANNADPQGYRRLRGITTTDAQRTTVARQYQDTAQMEDALDLLLWIKNISRYEVAVRPADVLRLLQPDAIQRPTSEIIVPGPGTTFADLRRRIKETLDQGGAAMLSLYHKGAGQTGTHLISIQAVTPTGFIVDDPYGRIRPTYNRNRTGDAYADPGQTRATSSYRNVVTRGDTDGDGFDDDWKLSPSQSFVDNESRGNSVEISDAVLQSAWNRVTIYRRPVPVAVAVPPGPAP